MVWGIGKSSEGFVGEELSLKVTIKTEDGCSSFRKRGKLAAPPHEEEGTRTVGEENDEGLKLEIESRLKGEIDETSIEKGKASSRNST